MFHESLSDWAARPKYLLCMSTKEEAGRRIKAARLAAGLTLKEVEAKIPEISFSRLGNWEAGTNMIGVDEAKKLAPLLGVSASFLLTLTDEPNEREKVLLEYFRQADERGRAQILRVAESESDYTSSGGEDADKAA